MKTILLLFLALTACAEDPFIFREGETTEFEGKIHTQKCYFPEATTLTRDKKTININAGDTINISDANKKWACYDGEILLGFAQIDTGETMYSDTVTETHQFSEYYSADSTWITIYHAGICTVTIDWK